MHGPAATQRYRRHDLIDWFSQEQVVRDAHRRDRRRRGRQRGGRRTSRCSAAAPSTCSTSTWSSCTTSPAACCCAKSDAGRNKAEAVAERARDLDPNVTVRAVPGDFWDTMSLGRLREYDCAIAAVDNFEARLRLNQLCLIARVNLVNAGLDSRWAVVESFPFATSEEAACYECTLPESAYARVAERYSCGGLRRRAGRERLIPTTAVTASVAGALAASMALRLGGEAPQARSAGCSTPSAARAARSRSSVARAARAAARSRGRRAS